MEEPRSESSSALERLIFLSDGVFAIAITLLVIGITVPEITTDVAIKLPGLLIGLLPNIEAYALSFMLVSIYWMTHQRIFYYIKRTDNVLIWLNVLFLMCVAFLPVPAGVLGRYGSYRSAVFFYVGSLTITGVFIILLWWYASSDHRLVDKSLDPALIRHHIQRSMIAPIIFLLSLGLALLSPLLAELSWLLIGVAFFIHERLYRRRVASRPGKATRTT